MEIVRERLEREFDLSFISTAPNVVYRVVPESGAELQATNPSDFPSGTPGSGARPGIRPGARSRRFSSPWPGDGTGSVRLHRDDHGTVQGPAGALLGMEYLSADRVEIGYTLPLAEIIYLFDQLKSRTRGYASLDYERRELEADLVKVDILLQGSRLMRSARSCTRTRPVSTAWP